MSHKHNGIPGDRPGIGGNVHDDVFQIEILVFVRFVRSDIVLHEIRRLSDGVLVHRAEALHL